MDNEVRDAIRQAATSSHLILAEKPLGQLPDEIRGLRHLKRLSVSRCEIEELPDWIGVLDQLEHLDLTNNYLADISPLLRQNSPIRVLLLPVAASWTFRQSAWLAGLMLAALVVIMGISVVTYKFIGVTAAVILGLSLAVIVVLGLFVLRSTGLISDETFAGSLKEALSAAKPDGGA